MEVQDYWNQIGSTKEFEDPLYIEQICDHLEPDAKIVEYGCGYGRMLRLLKEGGYFNLTGYDFAKAMIERGNRENPDLDLHWIADSGRIPEEDASADGVVMSTVLCSMVGLAEKESLIEEIDRVLKPGGVFYLTDFLICHHPQYAEKYAKGFEEFQEEGLYRTGENLIVKHYTSREIFYLLTPFDILWFEQFDFKTMNNNPARTFHCVAKKP